MEELRSVLAVKLQEIEVHLLPKQKAQRCIKQLPGKHDINELPKICEHASCNIPHAVIILPNSIQFILSREAHPFGNRS